MAYLALARKWRPKVFAEVVGQSHVVQALSNALDSGRVHHAFLFTGTRGVGKTTLARIFAKSLNCEEGTSAEPCQRCNTCTAIDEGRYVDLIEIDAASRTKVDDTRELLDSVQYAPTVGKFKVYLIDEVHMLSGHSFNALLKTLEEPPEHVKFLFATTDPQKLPVTVLSRCLQFNLRAMRPEQVENQLVKILGNEGLEFDQPALHAISKAADGSMRDGLSLLDQAIAQGGGSVRIDGVESMLGTIKAEHSSAILMALAENNVDQILDVITDMADNAIDFAVAIDDILMQLYYVSLAQHAPNALLSSDANVTLINDVATKLSQETVQLYYQIGLIGKRDIPLAPSLRVGFEMALLRMLAFDPVGLSAVSQQQAPQQKAPQQQAPQQQAPQQQAPQQQAPQQQAPQQQAPQQQAPQQKAPQQQAPQQQAPQQQAPQQQAPQQQAPQQQAPQQQAPQQQAPQQQAPQQQAPQQQAPQQQAPQQQAPQQQAPQQQAPQQQAPQQQAPQQQAPQQQAPQQQAPQQQAPQQQAPQQQAPQQQAPQQQAPQQQAPQQQTPSAIAVTLAGNNEWGELVEQTNLAGLPKELAMNCACEKLADDKILLCLSPKSQHLFKDSRVFDIQTAVQAVMNNSAVVTLDIEESDKETPAECLQRLGFEQFEQTKENLNNDPGVKALMSGFGATINEQSIKSIDPSSH